MQLQRKIDDLKTELATHQSKLDERERMWNTEFNGMKGAEGADRGIQTLIAPISILFRGKKKYTEEHRAQWVKEYMEKDVNVKALRIYISSAERQINTCTELLEKLAKDTLSPEEVERYLKQTA